MPIVWKAKSYRLFSKKHIVRGVISLSASNNENVTVEINIEELEIISNFIKNTSLGIAPTKIKDLSQIKNKYLKEIYTNSEVLYDYISQMNNYSLSISHGDLSVPFPERKNYLTAGLKELHSNMLHLIWKVKHVSKGKYNQKIDRLGQISDAFNQMLDCLKTREIEINQLRDVVKILFLHSNIMIFVINIENGDLIYAQEENKKTCDDIQCKKISRELIKNLNEKVKLEKKENYEWELYVEESEKWYHVTSLFTTWNDNQKVYFHMLIDISNQKQKIHTLQAQILRDPMTLVYNQAYAMEKLKDLIDTENNFSIAFIDIDGLKIANDLYGHDLGDKLIINFVKIVNYLTRGEDYFCRMGGDEFLLISINTSKYIMENILERIQINVDAFNELEIIPIQTSFSHGIETFDKETHTEAKIILKLADEKMYENKRKKYQEKGLGDPR